MLQIKKLLSNTLSLYSQQQITGNQERLPQSEKDLKYTSQNPPLKGLRPLSHCQIICRLEVGLGYLFQLSNNSFNQQENINFRKTIYARSSLEEEMKSSYQENLQTFQQHLEKAPDQLSQLTAFYLLISSGIHRHYLQNEMIFKQTRLEIHCLESIQMDTSHKHDISYLYRWCTP